MPRPWWSPAVAVAVALKTAVVVVPEVWLNLRH
jgi:hypothetical protein